MESLKTLLFVNASMALSFLIFAEGVKLCRVLGWSPGFAAAACFLAYAGIVWREFKRRTS